MSYKAIQTMLHEIQNAYMKRDENGADALCRSLFGKGSTPAIIGAGSDEWFFGSEEAKGLFLSDWANWGDFILDFDSLKYGELGGREWFSLRGGVLYSFEDAPETDSLFMRLTKEAASKGGSALERAGEILWLLSHALHRRENRVRKYLWHVTLSGISEDTIYGSKLRSLQFALPADALYPDERIKEANWERESHEKVKCAIARWNASKVSGEDRLKTALSLWHKDCGSTEWKADGQKRFMSLSGSMLDADEFLKEVRQLKYNWDMEFLPESIILDLRDDVALFYGLGLMRRKVCLKDELENVLKHIETGIYEDGQESLFRIRRDLCRVIKEAGSESDIVASCRIEGMAAVEGNKVNMHYFHLSMPYCHILEQKTDAADRYPK